MKPLRPIRPAVPVCKITPTPRNAPVRRSFYIRKRSGNNSGWFFGLFVLIVLGTGFTAYMLKNPPAPEKPQTPQEPEIFAQDGPLLTEPAPVETFTLPEIIENPESDGEVPPANSPVSEEHDAEIEPAAAPPPPPPPPKVLPKKLAKPKFIEKTIENKIVPNPDVPVAGKNRTVDILIVYTKATKERLGGPEGVLARANEVVAYTNLRFHDRKVQGTLRLVGLVETEYSPPEGADDVVKHGLGAISSGYATSGGPRKSIHKVRNKVGADLVCMWVNANRGGGGGLAQIHGAWSSMNLPVTSIFRHEMAHNFGWNHGDRHDYSMIQKNFPGMAKWNKTKMSKDKIYVQYWTDYEESGKK